MFGRDEGSTLRTCNKSGPECLDIQNTISFSRDCEPDLEERRKVKVKVKGILKSDSGNYVNFTQPSDMDLSWKADVDERPNKDEPYFLSTSRCPTWTSRNRPLPDGSGIRERELPCWADDQYEDSVPIAMSHAKHKGSNGLQNLGRTKKILIRICQLTSLLLVTLGIVTLVTPALLPLSPTLVTTTSNESTEVRIHEALEAWMLGPTPRQPESLLDIPKFLFILNNGSICESRPVYFMILVHSAPHHFVERQAIRTTWGSVRALKHWAVRVVFLLGQTSRLSDESAWLETQEQILRESEMYGDVVSGNFEDTYRNLSYKHLMGYRWALTYCPQAKFLLKTDDDAFIDLFQLFDFASRTYGSDPLDVLLCNVYPEGTTPVRNSSLEGQKGGRKWVVTEEEYPFDSYPKYCGGLGYLVTPDLASRLLSLSQSLLHVFWIDDVFVTGVIRELAGKEPYYLNLRYSYDPREYTKWLRDRSTPGRYRKIPFMFVHVDRGSSYSEDMAGLWRKTLRAWS